MSEAEVPRSPGPPIAERPAVPATSDRRPGGRLPRWPLWLLALALAWVAAVRVPLIVNAPSHIDSDLAVDGITLREAVAGHWRWHYPGTPFVGIVPVLYSWPQAMLWGANAQTLVSGGTVAYALVVAATFALAWGAFGRSAAAWGLVPLTFGSTGVLWLSGRITGGHLTAVACHAVGFLLLYGCLARGGLRRALGLGIWCGFGLYLDTMFVLTLAGLVPASLAWWWRAGRPRAALLAPLAFGLGLLVGVLPRQVGERVDPRDDYHNQFAVARNLGQLQNHLKLLSRDCLPRLISGHRLPDLQADPDPGTLGGPGSLGGPRDTSRLALAVTVVVLVLFLAAVRALADPESTRDDPAAAAVRIGLVASSIATLAAFLLYHNIYNSDNYRYLVDLLVPWSVGFGLSMRSIARLGRPGVVVASICSLAIAALMTLDTARWYRRYGWVDGRGLPVQRPLHDPALAWLDAHPEVEDFYGSYWDAYRLSFLAKRPVRGIPFPMFPNRFPEWSDSLPAGRPQILIARRFQGTHGFVQRAVNAGGVTLAREAAFTVVRWPIPADGRAPPRTDP